MLKSPWTVHILSLLLAFSASATELENLDFDLRRTPLYGQTITIDTTDQAACFEIQTELEKKSQKLKDLCTIDKERPYTTVVILSESPFRQTLDEKKITNISGTNINNTRNVFLLGAAGIARYTLLGEHPEHWKNPENKSPGQRWKDNLTAGPHFDGDDFRTNYIEHPIAGSIWYSIARHSGFSVMESFGFSVFSSTFMWEFGLENIYERPSINDLLVTPLIGSVLGELFFQVHQSVENNDGRVIGSPLVGSMVKVITNPGHYLSQGINQVLGSDWVDSTDLAWVVEKRHGLHEMGNELSSNALMLKLRIKFRR